MATTPSSLTAAAAAAAGGGSGGTAGSTLPASPPRPPVSATASAAASVAAAVAVAAAVGVAATAHLRRFPPHASFPVGGGPATVAVAVGGVALRAAAVGAAAWFLTFQAAYVAAQARPRELADPDSRWVDVAGGPAVHYKVWTNYGGDDGVGGGSGGGCGGAPPAAADPIETLVCVHGFGAALVSYEAAAVPALLAAATAAGTRRRVVALDSYGFGLSERPVGRSEEYRYTPAYMGGVAVHTVAATVVGEGGGGVVLVGHSVGGMVVAHAAVAALAASDANAAAAKGNPGGGARGGPTPRVPIDAVVLVAPALSPAPEAPPAGPLSTPAAAELPAPAAAELPAPAAAAITATTTATAATDAAAASAATAAESTAARVASNDGGWAPLRPHGHPARTLLAPLATAIGVVTAAAASVATAVLTAVLTPAAAAVLRLTVCRRSFWVRGLSSARGDGGAGLPPALVDGYRRAEGVRGWEAGLLAFSRAMAATRVGRRQRGGGRGWRGGGPAGREGTAAVPASAAPPSLGGDGRDLASRLADTGVPTLIIHGAADRLVPVRNSEALVHRWGGVRRKAQAAAARAKQSPKLVIMDGVGHVPHEEVADEWVRHVDAFLGRLRKADSGTD
ncbi:hypothetical protein MMPV_004962 [Pyropia vietnamensis]